MSKDKRNMKDPKAADKPKDADVDVKVEDRSKDKRLPRGRFPGPEGARASLRISLERDAYADMNAHARESLDAEICGVLAGRICEDDDGPFVEVRAIVRGSAARRGSTHVTFTQETWNQIHESMERDHPKLDIVGWYHSHPGFGVEFSEMDQFIQRNFFRGPAQIALVTDPLSGDMAVCRDTPDGIRYVERCWVEGREMRLRVPERQSAATRKPEADDREPAAGRSPASVKDLEARLGQVVQALDDLRNSYHRFLTFVGMLLCTALVFYIVHSIWSGYSDKNEPPKLQGTYTIPVMIDGKPVMLTVGVVGWKVPDELNAIMVQAEMKRREEQERAAATQKADGQAQTQSSGK